jgi:hypothetical protein
MLSLLKIYLGRVLNLAGFPALVRECEYESHVVGASVRVKRLNLYTLISVNGVDVYFDRITGVIDGVGTASPSAYCTSGSAQKSADLGVRHDTPQPQLHTRRTEAESGLRKGFAR